MSGPIKLFTKASHTPNKALIYRNKFRGLYLTQAGHCLPTCSGHQGSSGSTISGSGSCRPPGPCCHLMKEARLRHTEVFTDWKTEWEEAHSVSSEYWAQSALSPLAKIAAEMQGL